jgi:outer membrane protein insertion porin family
MKRYFLLLFIVVLNSVATQADEPFVVSDIRVEGLQRISAGSIFASLTINVGDNVGPNAIGNAIRTLFRTGNFDNVQIARDGTILVVVVAERPSISEINLEGNKAIDSESLLDGLKNAGLAEGKVFRRSTLEGMKMELTRQYVSQGRYDAGIETDIVSLPRNRVAVNIDIDEGTTASIKHINIVGNSVYSDEDLTDLFELKSSGWLSWITSDDKYAREKLSGDLDTLKSYYLDSGYIKFNIDSTQVSVSPDRESVYVTANITEGEKYEVGEVDLSGDIVLPENQLRPLVFVKKGQTFSQALVTSTEEWLTKRLGNEGYNFAKVEGIPDIDDETNTVGIKFFIDPGKRTYVNRIGFTGNARTADEVLRREMRQFESAPASSSAIEQSRIRLERLGYFKEAKVETKEIPGSDDLINLEYSVEEQSSGSIGASLGFSQYSGILLGANIQQDNFLGTGEQIGVGVNKSNYLTNVRFSYVDPYFTKDGVSRGFSVFYSERDFEQINVSNYLTNTLGASVNFGYPIKETERLGFSFGFTNTEVEAGVAAVQEIQRGPQLQDVNGILFTQYITQDFNGNDILVDLYDDDGLVVDNGLLDPLSDPGFLDINGDTFNNFTVSTSWSQSTLNRGRLATRGASQSLSFEMTLPGSDLEYFKLIYNGQIFFALSRNFTLRLRTELGYGDGFADTDDLPFFNHFYSGGMGSVRGFKSNTLGPRSTPAVAYFPTRTVTPDGEPTLAYVLEDDGTLQDYIPDNDEDPFGGNVLIEGGAELLFPLPFIKDQRSVRTAFFFDVGNVFSTNCGSSQKNCFDVDADELRYSVGIGLSWITGFGPLTFSLAKPLNKGDDDKIKAFEFSLGRSF